MFKKKNTPILEFFKVKCYPTDLIGESLAYWYWPKHLPSNNQYKLVIFFLILRFSTSLKKIK